ncbi:hypothetical protein M413DRAFT_127851 [Hebeloma cylindrosporum]|uniref:Uncharacterized protein n=1 Tax=Hebeloma cylindrosporum TaxID=76867 RepID=A0A0C2YMD3_HEBCY|nr:hypothetical protein M413DRAFT_127851 [Hebeloma cylindrosporum h7]
MATLGEFPFVVHTLPCGAGVHMKASIIYTYELPTGVSILPGFKLLALCRSYMAVYSIQRLESIPETENNEPAILVPDMKIRIESHWLNPPEAFISQPYVDDTKTRVAVTLKQGIYGLIVPTNGDPPRVTMISNDRFPGIVTCLGINRFFSQNSMTVWTASYTWPDDEAVGLDGNLRRTLPLQEKKRVYGQPCRYPVMDEETGRAVNGVKGGFVIFDWR